jgi:hypothetical protein
LQPFSKNVPLTLHFLDFAHLAQGFGHLKTGHWTFLQVPVEVTLPAALRQVSPLGHGLYGVQLGKARHLENEHWNALCGIISQLEGHSDGHLGIT